MAYIRQLNSGNWCATIRRVGHSSCTKTFRLKSDAEAWATLIEARIEGGATYRLSVLRSTTVADLLKHHRDEVAPHRRGWKWEQNRCDFLLRNASWVKLNLTMDIAGEIMKWIDLRLRGTAKFPAVKASTVNRELNMLSGIFRHAIQRLGIRIPDGNPIARVARPKVAGEERNLIWTERDFEVMLAHLKFNMAEKPTKLRSYLGWVLMLARLTGLRLGNVVGIRIENIDLEKRCIHFAADEVKNGEPYDCPLSKAAMIAVELLMKYREGEERLFPWTVSTIGALLRQERVLASLTHPPLAKLRTHDLRHTWTTETVPKVPNQATLLKLTGRRTMKSLNRYYHPPVEYLADLLDK